MIFEVFMLLVGVCIGLLTFAIIYLITRFKLKKEGKDALETSAEGTLISAVIVVLVCLGVNYAVIKPNSEAVVLDSIRVAEAEDAASIVDKGYVYCIDDNGKPVKRVTKFLSIRFSDDADGVYIETRCDEYNWLKSTSYGVLVIPESVSDEVISSW